MSVEQHFYQPQFFNVAWSKLLVIIKRYALLSGVAGLCVVKSNRAFGIANEPLFFKMVAAGNLPLKDFNR